MKNLKKCSVLFLTLTLFSLTILSCESVKEYQKSKINDSEMVLANRKIQKTENSFQTYREGASGANGGKTGGGCGCN
jgi:uncharacterized membrane protein YecN with MAPEG domain